jgi:hypothetical protein
VTLREAGALRAEDGLAVARPGRAIRIALGLSILVHLLLAAIPMREPKLAPPAGGVSGPLTVMLEPLGAPEPAAVAPPAKPAAPAPRPRPVPLAMPPRARPEPSVETVPVPEPQPPEPPPEPAREPVFDMSALIAANRARRRALEAAEAQGPSGSSGTPSASASDGLARNLASLARGDDTGGVFQILRIGVRTAEFSFNGWREERRRRWREVIEVDAGPGGDVQRAIIRRMIALIREHYTGNFNWESRRAGRVVVLSAAPADNAELEEYLMREFFGEPLVKRPP